MKTVASVELDNGEWIYMQVDESINILPSPALELDSGFESKGLNVTPKVITKLSDMIRAMTDMAANAVTSDGLGTVEKVTLEFSVTLGGELAIPMVTTGKAEGSVNISIEFVKPKTTNT